MNDKQTMSFTDNYEKEGGEGNDDSISTERKYCVHEVHV